MNSYRSVLAALSLLAYAPALALGCVGGAPDIAAKPAPDSGNENGDAGSDGTTGGDSGDRDGDASVNPKGVAGANLQLWLTADAEMNCNANRVALWKDQSGKGRNAAPNGYLGPKCGEHAINGKGVPYLSAPAGSAPFRDETLDVDLAFLANADYTILVVEKRWSDKANAFMIGTLVPPPQGTAEHDKGLHFGYVAGPTLILDQFYNRIGAAAPPASSTAAPSVSIGWFKGSVGHRLYVNGNKVDERTDPDAGGKTPLLVADNGSLGRAQLVSADLRYVGDIAEVIVYDKALDDAERVSLEVYLKSHWGLSF